MPRNVATKCDADSDVTVEIVIMSLRYTLKTAKPKFHALLRFKLSCLNLSAANRELNVLFKLACINFFALPVHPCTHQKLRAL